MRIFAPLLLGALLAALFARTTQAQTFVVDVNNWMRLRGLRRIRLLEVTESGGGDGCG
jgi:hypothetical protein